MKQFMDRDFLLATETARHLYQDYAANLPIIDYHCHLSPREIYEDVQFENITQVWLGGDHYKWRQMRSNGVEEKYITGDATDREKFQKWAETLELAIGNPLYHWSHLELRKYFGYEGYLCGQTTEILWLRGTPLRRYRRGGMEPLQREAFHSGDVSKKPDSPVQCENALYNR